LRATLLVKLFSKVIFKATQRVLSEPSKILVTCAMLPTYNFRLLDYQHPTRLTSRTLIVDISGL